MTKPNSPVFPTSTSSTVIPGLTKREHFAAIALQGLLASDVDFNLGHALAAQEAVRHADALIAELNKEGQS